MKNEIMSWRYNVPGEPEYKYSVGHGSAVLGADGFFAAVTDYGDYSFSWRYGKPKDNPHWFRCSFVCFDSSYLFSKLCKKDFFSPSNGIKYVREMISTWADDGVSQEEIDSELELINDLEQNPTVDYFMDWVRDSSITRDDGEIADCFYDYSPQSKAFVQVFIPRLQKLIREDLEREEYIQDSLCA